MALLASSKLSLQESRKPFIVLSLLVTLSSLMGMPLLRLFSKYYKDSTKYKKKGGNDSNRSNIYCCNYIEHQEFKGIVRKILSPLCIFRKKIPVVGRSEVDLFALYFIQANNNIFYKSDEKAQAVFCSTKNINGTWGTMLLKKILLVISNSWPVFENGICFTLRNTFPTRLRITWNKDGSTGF